jgi:N-acetyl-alpha-D-muramate 1-phosphate uridylyltransferase
MTLPVAILAGGLATRLRPLTETIPKALLKVAGRPFAEHQIEILAKYDIKEIVFCLGYLGELVQSTLGDGQKWGVNLKYVFDGPALLGTGGALQKALPYFGEAFFVLYGDSYLECNYSAMEQAFWETGKIGLMSVFQNRNQWDISNVLFEKGRIIRYDKNRPTPDMHHIDYGLGILRTEVFKDYPRDEGLDLATIYQDLVRKDELVGFEVSQRFYEIGSLEGLKETREYLRLKSKKNQRTRRS